MSSKYEFSTALQEADAKESSKKGQKGNRAYCRAVVLKPMERLSLTPWEGSTVAVM